MSASDRRRLARPGVAYPPGPRPDCSGRESGQTAGVVLDVPARTLTRRTGPVMSATGPDRMFRFRRRWRRLENGCRPGGWLCTVEPDRPPAEPRWPPPPFADLPHVTADPEKAFLPPGPTRSRVPSGQRERTKYGMGAECGMKTALIFVRCCGAHPLHPCGGECEFQHLSVS